MTKADFKKQYDRMKEIYGDKTKGHAAEWFCQFGHLDKADFERFVTQVINEHRPFGSDKWPLPGDFTHITGTKRGDPTGRPSRDHFWDNGYRAWVKNC